MRSFLSGCVCVLLVCSTSLIYAQKPKKPARNRQAVAKQPVGVTKSASKLTIGGSHVGLIGILEIKIDPALNGPLVISVSNGAEPVIQSNGDPRGRLVQELDGMTSFYKVQLALDVGDNIVDVMDSVDLGARAALKWRGVRPPGMAEDRMGSLPPAEDTPGRPPRVVRPMETDRAPMPSRPKTRARSAESRAEAEPDTEQEEPTDDSTVRSDSGRLVVVGIHDNKNATLKVDVGELKGPFTVTVTDADDKVVVERTKKLGREDVSFVETIPLKTGEYKVTVASTHAKETAETVTLGPWQVETPPAKPPAAFGANDFKESEGGNLSASATRVNGQVQLSIHTSPRLRGYKVKVVDEDDKEVDNRTFSDLDRGTNNWSLTVKAGKGKNTVTISSLDDKESIELAVPEVALLEPAVTAAPVTQEAVEYDWGRVRGYFAGGVIFSKERDDFSKSDIFLDFTLDKNYVARPFFGGLFKDFNTFFNARLTAIPVATAETAEAGDGGGEGGGEAAEPCNTPDCEGFITSKKAALMQAGIYLPMYWGFNTWFRKVIRPDHSFRWEKNALFIAPLAKGGIMTITGDRETSEGQQFGGDDVFNFYSFGVMLGHSRLHSRKKRDGYGNNLFDKYGRPIYEANPNIAPELISWLTVSAGRWENFEILVPTGQKNAAGEEIKVRERPWRIEALGRLKIPETPFIIGFDGNFGKGPDDVRFIFGTRFDIGKLMRTLKLAGQQDQVGQSQPPPAATTNTPPQP